MTKKNKDPFYVDIAIGVVREDWKRRSEMFPRFFNCSKMSKWMGVSSRALGYKLNSNDSWNITFGELCRYADATGNDVSVLLDTIKNRIKETDKSEQEKRRNVEATAFTEYCQKNAG